MKWSSIAVTGVLIGAYLFFTIYLFIYGYGRPDPNACYFVSGLDQPEKTRDAAIEAAKAANIEVKKGYPINMGHLFRVWFIRVAPCRFVISSCCPLLEALQN